MRDRIPHLNDFIHLNNAAGSLPDRSVYTAMAEHMELEARMGSTEAMLSVSVKLGQLYSDLGNLIQVSDEQIALFGSNTQAWQTPFLALDLKPGDRILVGETEWGGNISAIHRRCEATGAQMDLIPSDENGAIDVEALVQMLDDNVRVVCVTWVPAVNGLINPVNEIADVLGDHPAWLFVDAAQFFGQGATDLSNPRFDVTTVSTRKYIRGPRGLGFSVFSRRFLEQITPHGVDQFSGPFAEGAPSIRKDAKKFEYGESSYIVRMGLAQAVKLTLKDDWASIQTTITSHAKALRSGLSGINGVQIEDRGPSLSGIVTFSHERHNPAHFQQGLKARNINISAPKDIYAPLWFRKRPFISRLAPHAFNTQQEIETVIAAIADIAAQ
ncbi:aminotransferase class V-fold PLP-dependent enzyme [Kiloniella sp.]|uniref:aminotransferase class V-fold PLP-dependent enzyme n=1 Tax=Kiloniella sp. TaxID=1938587 RepID=UPI003B026CC8